MTPSNRLRTSLHSFVAVLVFNVTVTPVIATEKTQPNILWIMLDDGRADALGSYGQAWAKTPHFDSLAADGVRFRYAIVQSPVCTPSRTSMKTALYAHETGVMAMGKPPEITPAFAQFVRQRPPVLLDTWTTAGRRPVNFGKMHAFRDRFEHAGDIPQFFNNQGKPRPPIEGKLGPKKHPIIQTRLYNWMIGGLVDVKPEDMRTSVLGDRAVETVHRLANENRPFFLRVSFHAPHVPCHINPEHLIDPESIDLPLPTDLELAGKPRYEEQIRTYAGADLNLKQIRLARATYYSMISLVDDQVGRILAALRQHNLLENTIIAVNSDQGFQLGEHGAWKKRDFYDTNVLVPLIFRYPKQLPQGKVIDEPVELVDFLPTLLDLSGLDPPNKIRGRSLLPLIRGEVTQWREACFSEHDHTQDVYRCLRENGGRRVMVRTKEWKLIFFMDERKTDKDGALYDLKNDPWEKTNLWTSPRHQPIVQRLERMAHEWDRNTRS